METKHLTYFKVENFKRFGSLEVSDIGQFNLIVGDNNVGKTTLLEALSFDERGNQFLSNIWNILSYRKIRIPDVNKTNYIDFFAKNNTQPIIYQFEYNNKKNKEKLTITKKALDTLTNDEIEKVGQFYLLKGAKQYLIEFDLNNQKEFKFLTFGDEPDTFDKYCPLIGLSAIYGDDIMEFFSQVSIQTNKLQSLEIELKYFIPDLISIEINNAIVPQTPILAIREKNADLKPLAQYGDGAIKLLRYLLELELCENKRLMLDEIDTGIHYSRMKEFLKKVIQSAKNKNVQIFATTHSKECIEYYKQALQELGYENEGRVIRIADTKSGIKAYTINYAQLENSLFAESEIR